MSMLAQREPIVPDHPLSTPGLHGVHHTARPTWKLGETVRFYRDVLGLPICHAITARGWGHEDHPDFLHFFFDAGKDSTIAFFYYLKTEKPMDSVSWDTWLYRSAHTAWQVPDRETLMAWKDRLEAQGLDVLQVRHEIIESIYVTDPNGYMVEISWQMRPINEYDAIDASLTLEAAVELEKELGRRVETIDEIWQRKADLVERYLAE